VLYVKIRKFSSEDFQEGKIDDGDDDDKRCGNDPKESICQQAREILTPSARRPLMTSAPFR
jgi:hypothetical protein